MKTQICQSVKKGTKFNGYEFQDIFIFGQRLQSIYNYPGDFIGITLSNGLMLDIWHDQKCCERIYPYRQEFDVSKMGKIKHIEYIRTGEKAIGGIPIESVSSIHKQFLNLIGITDVDGNKIHIPFACSVASCGDDWMKLGFVTNYASDIMPFNMLSNRRVVVVEWREGKGETIS